MQTTKLATPVFGKVKEIEKGSSGYNVKVQVVKVEREVAANPIGGKKLIIIKAVVGDDTAIANAFFKLENADLIQEGKVYAIRNGRRNIVKGHISLEVDAFGRITEEKDDVKASGTYDISAQEIKRREREAPEGGERRRPKRREDDEEYRREPRKEGRRDRDDRDERRERRDRDDRRDRDERRDRDDRRGGDREERREREDRRDGGDRREREDRRYGGDRRRYNRDRDYDRREGGERRDREDRRDRAERGPRREGGERRRDNDQPVTYIKIKDIGPGDEEISFVAKVLKLNERSETRGSDERTFLDCILGDSTGVVNGSFFANTRVKEGNIYSFKRVNARVIKDHIQIQKGKTGFIEENESTIKEVNEKNNISAKAYELEY